MAVYGYLRVSTETQAEKGGGIETQRQNIQKYADAHDLTISQWFTDAGISGAVKDTDEDEAISKRPALIEMLASLVEGDTVIVLNSSRLWRSDTAKVIIRRELMKRKARVILVENERYDLYAKNPNDRFMDGIMELMDEWERLTIAMKLAKGRTAKAKGGDKPAGTAPYGYAYSEDKKHIVITEEEAVIIRRIFTNCQKGMSLNQIADDLTKSGISTRNGKKWSAGGVQHILRNRFYIGELQHQGKPIKGNHEPIISRVQFGKCSAQLDKRRRG